jgi:hypothetical protein
MATQTTDYEELAPRVVSALREVFSSDDDLVKVERGQGGRVRVLVVSDKLNNRSEEEKQDLIWTALARALGPDPVSRSVSLAIAYGTDELM